MKILIGITRALVNDDGTICHLLRGADVWEVEVPEDGSEYLARIWMQADGIEVLNLPLTMGSTVSRLYGSI